MIQEIVTLLHKDTEIYIQQMSKLTARLIMNLGF